MISTDVTLLCDLLFSPLYFEFLCWRVPVLVPLCWDILCWELLCWIIRLWLGTLLLLSPKLGNSYAGTSAAG